LKPAVNTISYRNLLSALPLVGCGQLCLANLLDVPSKDQTQLETVSINSEDVDRSRLLLQNAIVQANEILIAWGSGRLSGSIGATLREQSAWFYQEAALAGFRRLWMVAGAPQHPSRWRQYVGPEKQRVQGDTFEERLAKVLASHPINVPSLAATECVA